MSSINLNQPYNPLLPNATAGSQGVSPAAQGPAQATDSSGLTAAQREQLLAAQGGVGQATLLPGTQGAPPLPNAAGGTPSVDDRSGAANGSIRWLQAKPFHIEEALQTVSDVTRDSYQQAGELRRTAQQSELTEQSNSYHAQIKEVQGERESAGFQFAGAAAGAVVSGLGGALGTKLALARAPEVPQAEKEAFKASAEAQFSSQKDIDGAIAKSTKDYLDPLQKGVDKSNTWGYALQAAGNAAGQVVSKGVDLVDTYAGGKWDADNAKIAKGLADQLAATYKVRTDEFTQAQQQAQQSLQSAYVDTRKEIYNNINSTQQAIAGNM